MRSRQPARSALALALAAAAASCDPQADSGYQGEPLLTLVGQVQSSGALPPLEAAMLWQRGAPPDNSDTDLATRAPVESGFPASFTLRLFQPAPAAARRTLAPGEPLWARANAAAVPYGIAISQVGDLPTANNPSYGIDPAHWVIWLDSDVAPGSLTEWWLGAAMPAGFHLLRVASINPQCLTGALLDTCAAGLVQRGVPDDGTSNPGTARSYCLQPYRLSPAVVGEQLLLMLGSVGLGPSGGNCP